MIKSILKLNIYLLLAYLIGYVVIYNIIIQGRDLSQIPWRPQYLLLYSILGSWSIIRKHRKKSL